jgi:DNA repair/transcription protein MET18/MMS19
MNDHHSLIPDIILGVEAVSSMSNLMPEDLRSLFRAFFVAIHTQSQVVHERRIIFNLIAILLTDETKLKQLKPLGSEVVLAFIQAVDAEKDPVNMRLIFSLWPIVIENFTLEPFEEDIFEAMSCYFPIDFSPPKHSGQLTAQISHIHTVFTIQS